MWKCMRCEKENQDTEETCTGCGHGRTMDYISHRTLSKVANALSRNWKRVDREEAEEFVQKKLTDLNASVQEAKKKISDAQNEINTLNGEVQERNKIIEKNEKKLRVTDVAMGIAMILTWIGGILYWLKALYEMVSKGRAGITGIEYIKQDFGNFLGNVIIDTIGIGIGFYFLALVLMIIFQLIAITIVGSPVDQETIKKFTEELDNAQQSITEKTNEITTVQSELNSSEQQLKKIKKDKESIINKLSQLSPQEMEKEFARLV